MVVVEVVVMVLAYNFILFLSFEVFSSGFDRVLLTSYAQRLLTIASIQLKADMSRRTPCSRMKADIAGRNVPR